MEKRKILESEESLDMDENDYRIDKIHREFYRIIRNVILFFIGFGAPLNGWLDHNDTYNILLDKYHNLWLYYRIYSWLLIHLCLVLNASSLVYLLVWMNKDVSELCQQIVQLIWSLSAAVALDSSYYYRNSTLLKGTCKKIEGILSNNFNNNKNFKQYRIYDIKIPLHLKFIKHFYKLYSIPKFELVMLFMFPIIFNLYLYTELIFNFNRLNIEKILNLFMFMNIFIVTVNILIYLAFSLVFRNKFRHLNKYIETLIETKNTTIEQLYIISKWYKHNYSKVNKFDSTFNIFIVTFYISIFFNIVVSLYGIILQTHMKIDRNFKNLLIYNIFYYSFIACNTLLGIIFCYIGFRAASDVNVVSDKTKKLIEKYVTCTNYEKRSVEFNIEYQHFNTTVFSKPVHLTLFGLGSITKMSFGLAIISFIPYIPNIIEFSFKHRLPINEKDITAYFDAFVNETMESLENND